MSITTLSLFALQLLKEARKGKNTLIQPCKESNFLQLSIFTLCCRFSNNGVTRSQNGVSL